MPRDREKRYQYHKEHYVDTGYMKEYQHQWYLKNKEKIEARTRAYGQRCRALLSEYKVAKGCNRCGYNRSPSALHIHHPNGKENKKEAVSILISQGHRWETILAICELCEVVCANCHAEHHEEERDIAALRKMLGHADDGSENESDDVDLDELDVQNLEDLLVAA